MKPCLDPRLTHLSAMLAISTLTACSTWLPAVHQTPSVLTSAPIADSATEPSNSDSQWPSQSWWLRYQDATLNQLIDRSLAAAPTLKQASARFAVASESVRLQAAQSGLQVAAQGSVTRIRLSDNGLLPAQFLGFNWYTQADLGLQASYHFDWWRQRQHMVDAAVFQARAAQAEQRAAANTLSGAITQSYWGWQSDQAQLDNLDSQLTILDQQSSILSARLSAKLDTADASYQLQAQRAQLLQLRAGWETSAHLRRVLIASLVGVRVDDLPIFTRRALQELETKAPTHAAVDVLVHRADIASAFWRIKASDAQLGAARAQFMPDISINALAALSSIDLAKLFNAGSAAPNIGINARLPIFDSGLLKAQYGARAAELDAAVASYNQTVINAAREVVSATVQLQGLERELTQSDAQHQALVRLTEQAQARHQQGLTDLRPALSAQQAMLQQRGAWLNTQAARINADVQLQLALGAGFTDSSAINSASVNTP